MENKDTVTSNTYGSHSIFFMTIGDYYVIGQVLEYTINKDLHADYQFDKSCHKQVKWKTSVQYEIRN